MKEKKKITSLDCFVTKTENEIIYGQASKIYKMDMKTKRRQVLRTDDKDDMYQVDLEDWKPVYIGKKGRNLDCIETEGINLYFETQDEDPDRFKLFNIKVKNWFAKYNLQSGKKVKLFDQERLVQEVEKLGKTWKSFTNKLDWEERAYPDIEVVYYHENRLYIALMVTGKGDEWEARLMFSCQASDGSDFRFEKEVTEYLWKNSIPYQNEYDDEDDENTSCDPIIMNYIHVTGEFLYFVDGCIVMHFYDKEAKGDGDAHHRFAVYDISTGSFQKVKRYSKEYGYFKALGFRETRELIRY